MAEKAIDLDRLIYEGAIKLEITSGVPTWEVSPNIIHQETIDLIRASIEPAKGNKNSEKECGCFHYSDIHNRSKDGSLKRPDIAIFGEKPPKQDAITMIPQAIIEVVSPGYEYKDIALNPQFYLAQDTDDVVIVDPRSEAVTHYYASEVTNHRAPVMIDLQWGCRCTIPD
jgi:hypothetical protein